MAVSIGRAITAYGWRALPAVIFLVRSWGYSRASTLVSSWLRVPGSAGSNQNSPANGRTLIRTLGGLRTTNLPLMPCLSAIIVFDEFETDGVDSCARSYVIVHMLHPSPPFWNFETEQDTNKIVGGKRNTSLYYRAKSFKSTKSQTARGQRKTSSRTISRLVPFHVKLSGL